MQNKTLDAEVLVKKNELNPNDKDFRNDADLVILNKIEKVVNFLKEANFTIVAISPNSISIEGEVSNYERVFNMITDNEAKNEPITVPEILKDSVEGIYLQNPPTLF